MLLGYWAVPRSAKKVKSDDFFSQNKSSAPFKWSLFAKYMLKGLEKIGFKGN